MQDHVYLVTLMYIVVQADVFNKEKRSILELLEIE